MMHLCKTFGNFWPPSPTENASKITLYKVFPPLQKIPLFCPQISPFCVNLAICGPFFALCHPHGLAKFSLTSTPSTLESSWKILLAVFKQCNFLSTFVGKSSIFVCFSAIRSDRWITLQKMCSITLLFSKIATLLRIFILIIQNIDCFWCSLFFESSLQLLPNDCFSSKA